MTRTIAILALIASTATAAMAAGQRTAVPAPTITASPNPVPLNQDVRGTTITWSTGNGSDGVVRVSVNGGPEQLFADGTAGSSRADWIDATSVFEFRLYSADNPRRVVASVKVSREQPSREPRVDLTPGPAEIGRGLATVSIAWTTGDQSDGEVHVSKNGEPERLVARGPAGTVQVNWIDRAATYDFTLYSVAQPRQRLAGARLAPAPATPATPTTSSHDRRDVTVYLVWLAVVALFAIALARRFWKPASSEKPDR